MTTMRDLGVGKKSLEERILTEAEEVKAELAEHAGKSRDISYLLQMAVTNVICSIIFADR